MLSTYRREFTDFNINLNFSRYLYVSGQKVTFPISEVYNRYSDLFSLTTINSLKKELSETKEHYETAHKALCYLVSFASQQHLNLKTKTLSQEISQAENRLYITWQDQKIPLRNINYLLLKEPDHYRRQEIYKKKLSVLSSLNDLKAEQVEKHHQLATELGYQNYLQMFSELNKIDYLALDSQFQRLLAQTEKLYSINLKRYLATNLRVPLEIATSADILHFTRREKFTSFFPARTLITSCQETLSGLGIRFTQQNNLSIDKQPRPEKQFTIACLPINVPDQIKLVCQLSDGIKDYELFFHAMGKAQNYAFTSSSLAPEFKYAGNNALAESFGFLFRSLINNSLWLEQMLDERESNELQTANLLTKLYLIRRYAAKLHFEIALHSKGLVGQATLYTEEITQATLFQAYPAEYLADYLEGFYVANYLKALLFETMLKDYLKTHYGSKWWESRRAGNLLKEMWEVGTLYSVEEFAKQLNLGSLIIEPLETEFLLGLKA